MKYAIERGSSATIYGTEFSYSTFVAGDSQIRGQRGDLISLHLFLRITEVGRNKRMIMFVYHRMMSYVDL
jgi:hypothetical protein